MSRSGGGAAMLDIRSSAILQDVVFSSNPCAPGASKARRPSHQFYGPAVLYPGDPGFGDDDHKRYDKHRDWVVCIASAVITGTILGIVHSYGILIPKLNDSYGVGQVEAIIVGALTYAVLIMFGPLACCLIKTMGQRITCVFGMLLFFIGLMLDAFQIHRAVFFITHIVLLGIGGSFAYTSAVSSVVDHFRESLPIALVIISASSPIGTAIYYTLSDFLIGLFPKETAYMWLQLILAIIVLVLIAATHVFPSRLPRQAERNLEKPRGQRVKECIEKTAQPERASLDPCGIPQPTVKDPENEQKSCLCVCVIDVSVWTDMSFLLWALISLCALLSFFIPYLFLAKYAREIVQPDDAGDTLHLILWFCLASLVARVATLMGTDHTFTYNRSMFQGVLLGSGIMYIFVVKATTFGWITVWALVVGGIEGAMTTVIPRVTLQTIPRKWMASSWSYVVIMHGFGVLLGPMIVVSAWAGTGGFYGVGFVVVGIAQIIAGLLAFILPNEEDEEDGDNDSPAQSMLPPLRPDSYYFGPNSYTKRLAEYTSTHGGAGGSSFNSKYSASEYCGCSGYSTYTAGSIGIGGLPDCCNEYSSYNGGGIGGHPYSTDCPICSKIGVIPGCCDMGLPGLSIQTFGTTVAANSRFTQSVNVSGFSATTSNDPYDPCLTEMAPLTNEKPNSGAAKSTTAGAVKSSVAPQKASSSSGTGNTGSNDPNGPRPKEMPSSNNNNDKSSPVGVVKPSVAPRASSTKPTGDIEIRQKTTTTNTVHVSKHSTRSS